jgi:hypothetical protein
MRTFECETCGQTVRFAVSIYDRQSKAHV